MVEQVSFDVVTSKDTKKEASKEIPVRKTSTTHPFQPFSKQHIGTSKPASGMPFRKNKLATTSKSIVDFLLGIEATSVKETVYKHTKDSSR